MMALFAYFILIESFPGRQPLVRRISGQYSSLQAALLVLIICTAYLLLTYFVFVAMMLTTTRFCVVSYIVAHSLTAVGSIAAEFGHHVEIRFCRVDSTTPFLTFVGVFVVFVLFERSEFLIPTCGPPVIALYSKEKVREFVRFNLNLDQVTRKMSAAVLADHTKKKKKSYLRSPVIINSALLLEKKSLCVCTLQLEFRLGH